MTDLCMYEFEETVWDKFCQSDDHIVPHPGLEWSDTRSILSDSCKKPCSEVAGASCDIGDKSAAYVEWERKPAGFSYLRKRKNTMLEKDPCAHTPSGVFSSSDSGSMKDGSSLASGSTKSSTHGVKSNNTDSNGSELCTEYTILGEKNVEVGRKSFSYTLGDITHSGNNLDFFENAEDKDSSDLLYYGWPEIGNFEDADGMFRSCDSIFGLGASNEDELAWFSSVDEIGGSGDLLESDFKSPRSNANISENHDENYFICDSAMSSERTRHKDGPWVLANGEPCMSFGNEPANADNGDGFTAKEQEVGLIRKIQPPITGNSQRRSGTGGMVDERKRQIELYNQFMGRRKENHLGNGSFSYTSNQSSDIMQLSSEANSHQSTQSAHLQQITSNPTPVYAYLRKGIPPVNTHYCNFPDPSMMNPPRSTVKSEANSLMLVSLKDSSHASSHLQSRQVSHDPSFLDAAISKREKVHEHPWSQISQNCHENNTDVNVQSSCDPGLIGKQVHFSTDKCDSHGDAEGVIHSVSAELGISRSQENSTMSSGLDDVSLEAASFGQLQLAMGKSCSNDDENQLFRDSLSKPPECLFLPPVFSPGSVNINYALSMLDKFPCFWLDSRTKLCIRDSLYRLACSAEQRHNCANTSCFRDEGDHYGGFMADGTNKCPGFLDIETNTNPIDRSIAHLLFHQPSKSPTQVHGFVTSPIKVENLVAH